MRPITTFGMAVVLASVLAAPGFAVVSSEQAREANVRNQAEPSGQTATPWSSTMNSANTLSHDDNSKLRAGKSGPQDNNSAATSSCGSSRNSIHGLPLTHCPPGKSPAPPLPAKPTTG